jgi:RHS repeat-associated protein
LFLDHSTGQHISKSVGGRCRYGFNGKENDNEVKGVGDQIDYGMRVYDPRAGRFMSGDPVTSAYAMLTPYQYASNRPVDGIDFDGKEWVVSTQTVKTTAGFEIQTSFVVRVKVENK